MLNLQRASLKFSFTISHPANSILINKLHVTNTNNIFKNSTEYKDRLSKPRSQIKGVELLRNPSLFKVSISI